MCGIAGSINFPNIDTKTLKQSLHHRGPDENGECIFGNVTLIHTRLAIQDVFNGQQPFRFKHFLIVFNGEIYNHLDLRKSYLCEVDFKTKSDTETLLRLFVKYQDKALDMVDGMFAFAILDIKTNKLFFGRDRVGKKPLYFYKKGARFLFSSELNTIKDSIGDIEIDSDSIYGYLRSGFFFGDTTPYKNVAECDPGFLYEIDCKSLSVRRVRFFDILEFYKKDKIYGLDQAIGELDRILHTSVENRVLSSDLEVGAFLSGGIDSSLIVAIASEYVSNIKTFTVGFEGSFDESHLADLTARKYGTDHYNININLNLKEDIEKILLGYGEPFMDSSAIPSYYVSAKAKEYVSVVLNGDGADELFGGYRRYVPISLGLTKFSKYFSFIGKALPNPKGKASIYNYLYRLLSASGKSGAELYSSMTNDIFEDVYPFEENEIFNRMDSFIGDINNSEISVLSKFLCTDLQLIMKNDLLKKMDIATMSHSIEARSPFLSKYMLEYTPTISDSLKVKGVTTKFILRELSKRYLSRELISQPKRGFEVPLRKWVDCDLRENIFDTLGGDCFSGSFISKSFIQDTLDGKNNIPVEKRAKILWTMYALDIWKKGVQ